MPSKTSQLQIRITLAEKRELKRRARAAGQDVSSYVLSRVLPPKALELQRLLEELDEGGRFALAELNDLLEALHPGEFASAVENLNVSHLSDFLQNYVAAMVEMAAHRKDVQPPDWPQRVEPLATPVFGTELRSLRPYMLRASPVPFKRRNIFIDASVGSRV